jgi:hypothetical protein
VTFNPVHYLFNSGRATWVVILVLLGCDGDPRLPNESYAMPTAIIGVPVKSPNEAEAVRSVLKEIGTRYRLIPYKQRDVPTFAEECRRVPERCPDQEYLPPNPRWREGFSIALLELSSRCFLIKLSEYSGIWSERSLRAVNDLEGRLMDATEHTAQLLVPPKPEQNWPTQISGRPNQLAELCVRMGLQESPTQRDEYPSPNSQKRP